MNIYSRTGIEIIDIVYSSADYHEVQLMDKDVVYLEFVTNSILDIGLGAYVVIENSKYYLIEPVYPEYDNNTGGYKYSINFVAHYFRPNNDFVCFDRQPISNGVYLNEMEFSLTGTLTQHLDILKSNIKNCGYTYNGLEYVFNIDTEAVKSASEIKNISYSNVYIIDALNMICEEYQCEWWCIGNVYYLGKCNTDSKPYNLRHHYEFNSIQINRTNTPYFNRLYVFGSDRNIPYDYRTVRNLQAASNVQKRLCLPVDKVPLGYIDIEADFENGVYSKSDKYVVSGYKTYDDIFPSHISVCDLILTGTGTETNETTGEKTEFTTFLMRDKDELGMTVDDVKDGEKLYLTFQEGSLLAGLKFEVKFHETYSKDGQTYHKIYEIVRNNNYGSFLPNDLLKPQLGDKFILENFEFKSTQKEYCENGREFTVYKTIGAWYNGDAGSEMDFMYFSVEGEYELENCIPDETHNVAVEFLSGSLAGKVFKVVVMDGHGFGDDIPQFNWNSVHVLFLADNRYGVWYPKENSVLPGDKFKLYFYPKDQPINNSLFVKYLQQAEDRLLEDAINDLKYIKRFGNIDSFTITMNPVFINGGSVNFQFLRMVDGIFLSKDGLMLNMRSLEDSVWSFSEERRSFQLGDSFNLISEVLKNASFPTRVLGFKKMLDGSGNDSYTCGINRSINVLKNIENRLNKLEYGK